MKKTNSIIYNNCYKKLNQKYKGENVYSIIDDFHIIANNVRNECLDDYDYHSALQTEATAYLDFISDYISSKHRKKGYQNALQLLIHINGLKELEEFI